MAYREFRFDGRTVRGRVRRCKKNILAKYGTDDLVRIGAPNLMSLLRKNGYKHYRAFGMYWPAVKDIFIAQGLLPAECTPYPDRAVAKAYRGKTDEDTLVMAEMFKDYYFSHYFVGTNTFLLDVDDEEEWTLFDPEMEQLALLESMDF